MAEKAESEEHRRIKLSLADGFRNKGWAVKRVDGEGEETDVVENKNKVGDKENKKPDVDAKSSGPERIIRGEAKVNNGDFDSEHSITQYKLFSSLNLNGVNSWLIIGVPANTKELMEAVLERELDDNSRGNIAVWER
ncbi:MAG: hypothetical protein COV69_02370 [Parcubacteria group bacterium CG11_big_fil_rev_8_21_14_0_20_39_14]|nr:MAG: hypothetical protein COV69_02370 [Parcubacteria group bacterium CG11_big_fil_rev_8_21_14_0_20_39_14]PIS35650.1 MAG: hypothetical protein COT36_01225 [Parcubacteria group bacterium CG08_land_8_20_14_0_20_38_56]